MSERPFVALDAAHDDADFGGKAASLARLLAADLPVPGGIALSWSTVDAIAADPGGPEAEALREWAAAERASRSGVRLACRSSAVGEDGAGSSFAGQHTSVLGVDTPDDVVRAALDVHASAHGEGARAYRARLGLTGEARMGLVVQRMVDPTCAGVLFSHDPVTQARGWVLEAAWGLGEAVVAGLVIPDRVVRDDDGGLLERTPGTKDVQVKMAEGGRTEETAVPAADIERMCVSEADEVAVVQMGARARALFGHDVDVEWAIAEQRVWLLQCRPATA